MRTALFCNPWTWLQPPSVAAYLCVSAFSFVFINSWNHALLAWDQVAAFRHQTISHFFALRNSFRSTRRVVINQPCEVLSNQICSIWLNPSREYIASYTSQFILMLRSAVASSISTTDPVPLAAVHAHHLTASDRCHGCSSHHSGTSKSWFQRGLLKSFFLTMAIMHFYLSELTGVKHSV